jgi:hypothetical protein
MFSQHHQTTSTTPPNQVPPVLLPTVLLNASGAPAPASHAAPHTSLLFDFSDPHGAGPLPSLLDHYGMSPDVLAAAAGNGLSQVELAVMHERLAAHSAISREGLAGLPQLLGASSAPQRHRAAGAPGQQPPAGWGSPLMRMAPSQHARGDRPPAGSALLPLPSPVPRPHSQQSAATWGGQSFAGQLSNPDRPGSGGGRSLGAAGAGGMLGGFDPFASMFDCQQSGGCSSGYASALFSSGDGSGAHSPAAAAFAGAASAGATPPRPHYPLFYPWPSAPPPAAPFLFPPTTASDVRGGGAGPLLPGSLFLPAGGSFPGLASRDHRSSSGGGSAGQPAAAASELQEHWELLRRSQQALAGGLGPSVADRPPPACSVPVTSFYLPFGHDDDDDGGATGGPSASRQLAAPNASPRTPTAHNIISPFLAAQCAPDAAESGGAAGSGGGFLAPGVGAQTDLPAVSEAAAARAGSFGRSTSLTDVLEEADRMLDAASGRSQDLQAAAATAAPAAAAATAQAGAGRGGGSSADDGEAMPQQAAAGAAGAGAGSSLVVARRRSLGPSNRAAPPGAGGFVFRFSFTSNQGSATAAATADLAPAASSAFEAGEGRGGAERCGGDEDMPSAEDGGGW